MNVTMTARKVVSALISIFVFNAKLGQTGMIGCAMVIGAMLLEFQTSSSNEKSKIPESNKVKGEAPISHTKENIDLKKEK